MKRIYIPNAAYLITTNPVSRINYFEEDILAEILIHMLKDSIKLKGAELIGYKINSENVHLIIKVGTAYNISQVMHSIKRVSTDKINQVLCYKRNPNPYETFTWTKSLVQFRDRFLEKYGSGNLHEFPIFK